MDSPDVLLGISPFRGSLPWRPMLGPSEFWRSCTCEGDLHTAFSLACDSSQLYVNIFVQ